MILDNIPYLIAFLLTASIHTAWPLIPSTIHQQFSLLVSTRLSASGTIIKLHVFALLLLVFSLSFRTTSAISLSTSQDVHTYTFDDLSTTNGLGPLTSYGLLTFTGFSVLAPLDPNLPYIHPSDRNCATSSPNALLGSRYGPQEHRPTITINETATQLDRFNASFNLHSISIKPLAMPLDRIPVMANLSIRGWQHNTDADPLVFRVEWTSGYADPLRVDFNSAQFSSVKWEELRGLEFAVEYGLDGLDWEFCLDDLEVGFLACGVEECEDGKGDKRGKEEGESAQWEEL